MTTKKESQNWHFFAINILYSLHGFSPTSGHQTFFEYVINRALQISTHGLGIHASSIHDQTGPPQSTGHHDFEHLVFCHLQKLDPWQINVRKGTETSAGPNYSNSATVHYWLYTQFSSECLMVPSAALHGDCGSWSTLCLLVSSTTQQTWWNNKDQQSTSWSTYGTGTPSIFFQYLHTTTISISYQAGNKLLLPPWNLVSCCSMKSHLMLCDEISSCRITWECSESAQEQRIALYKSDHHHHLLLSP